MPYRIRAFFARHADLFTLGELDEMVRGYEWPLAVYTANEIRLENTPDDTLRALWAARSVAWKRGAVLAINEVLDIAEDLTQRFPVLIRWHFEAEDGTDVGVGDMIYFCEFSPAGEPRIHMLEILVHPFPEAASILNAPRIEH